MKSVSHSLDGHHMNHFYEIRHENVFIVCFISNRARDILLAFENDARLQVTKYIPWKHDKGLRRLAIFR